MFNITKRNAAGTSADAHRNAYNAAFYELGLPCHFDSAAYQEVLCDDGERACLRQYLERHHSHLLRAYDASFLVDAIVAAKARCYDTISAAGATAGGHIDWAEIQQSQVGV
jgi:hypothetical protein